MKKNKKTIKEINIIQSYSLLKNNIFNDKNQQHIEYSKLYAFTLSYLTLKKYGGNVTMFCDQLAYDNLIKYIPYDKIVILENKHINTYELWNHYKLTTYYDTDVPFIHVDSDVFIFDRLLDGFINGGSDIITQDIRVGVKMVNQFVSDFHVLNGETLKKHGLIDNNYKIGFTGCGVIGFKDRSVLDTYIKYVDRIVELYFDNELIVNPNIIGWLSEEHSVYNVAQQNKYKIDSIIPMNGLVNNIKYTHLWGDGKYKAIDLIKNKICSEFPEYKHLINIYDKIIADLNISI